MRINDELFYRKVPSLSFPLPSCTSVLTLSHFRLFQCPSTSNPSFSLLPSFLPPYFSSISFSYILPTLLYRLFIIFLLILLPYSYYTFLILLFLPHSPFTRIPSSSSISFSPHLTLPLTFLIQLFFLSIFLSLSLSFKPTFLIVLSYFSRTLYFSLSTVFLA